MADLRYNPKRRSRQRMLDRTYPYRISRFLDAHEIPNVLWGEFVMNMFLIPIVPDVRPLIPPRHNNYS